MNNNHRHIDAMRDKRYDNSRYRAARTQSAWTLAEPPLSETVAAIVTFLQRENLIGPVPRSGAASQLAGEPAVPTV